MENLGKSQYTRTGARRSGDYYQDIVALGVLVEMLEHPDRYQWARVEADDAGYLDDVVALRSDNKLVVKQVKFSTHPEEENDPWDWEGLLKKTKSKAGKSNKSLLEKWSSTFEELYGKYQIHDAGVVSNRRAGNDLMKTISADGLVVFDDICDPRTKEIIVDQIGDETKANRFFSEFHFYLDQQGLEELENSVKKRFYNLGGTDE